MTGDIFAIVPEADSLYTFGITTPNILLDKCTENSNICISKFTKRM